MTKLLQNPALGAAFALLLGTAAGVFPLWRAAQGISLAPFPAGSAVPQQEKAKGWDFWTIEIDNLASELKEEKARLRKQAEQIELRAGRVASERAELDKLRQQLEGLRAEIGGKVAEIKAEESKNLKALAQTYSNLTPRAAVAIIRELDDVTAVKILFLMKPDIVGPIFEEMSRTASPEGTLARRAALLSERLRLIRTAKAATPS
jgi:flagellar motility protein MotE (MotC chaperone)